MMKKVPGIQLDTAQLIDLYLVGIYTVSSQTQADLKLQLGARPARSLLRRPKHMAQCEIKKDNKSDLLIRVPWEKHFHFGKIDSPSEPTCP